MPLGTPALAEPLLLVQQDNSASLLHQRQHWLAQLSLGWHSLQRTAIHREPLTKRERQQDHWAQHNLPALPMQILSAMMNTPPIQQPLSAVLLEISQKDHSSLSWQAMETQCGQTHIRSPKTQDRFIVSQTLQLLITPQHQQQV